jgi:hypothetical protein
MRWLKLAASLWLSALLVGCVGRPGITADNVKSSLIDPKTGKVHAGNLGLADLSSVLILDNRTQGDRAVVEVDVKATQNVMDEHYDLSAQLRLSYVWGRSGWELMNTQQLRQWVSRGPRQSGSRTRGID